MTPIRANMVGPPRSAISISASIAACHWGRAGLLIGKRGDVIGGVAQGDERAAVRHGIVADHQMPPRRSRAKIEIKVHK
jgi:hypothetical protein